MTRLEPTKEIVRRLFAVCGNVCAFPDCNYQIFDDVGTYLGEVAHIEAAEPDGPRYNSEQTDDERRDFNNLVVLCPSHHRIIDKKFNDYSVTDLKQIKLQHESNSKQHFHITEEQIEKIIEKIRLVQKNVFIGSGTQLSTQTGNITVQQGLSYDDTEKLVMGLFEKNFLQLVEKAAIKAEENAKKFARDFFEQSGKNLSAEQQEKFSDPDIQYALGEAIKASARKDSKELRTHLSSLIIKRVQNDGEDLQKIVLNEAIVTLPKLTIDEIKIITLCFALRYSVRTNVVDINSFEKYLSVEILPLLDFKNTNAKFQHIVYCSCGTISIGHADYTQLLTNKYESVFLKSPFTKQEIDQFNLEKTVIDKLFNHHESTGSFYPNFVNSGFLTETLNKLGLTTNNDRMINAYNQKKSNRNEVGQILQSMNTAKQLFKIIGESELENLSLTSVGIAIAVSYIERLTSGKIDLSIWIH